MSIRRRVTAGLCSICCLLVTGCAWERSFSAPGFADLVASRDEGRTVQVTAGDIARAFEARPQLRLPASLAVYEHTYPGSGYEVRDNEMVEFIVADLEDDENFAGIDVLTPRFVRENANVHAVRLAAARHGADLTLLCDSDFEVKSEVSVLSLLDLTVIGAFIVPSERVKLESRVSASLIDTRNGHVYRTVVASDSWDGMVPSARGRSTVEKRRRELAERNYQKVLKKIRAVRPSPAAAAPVAGPVNRATLAPVGARYETGP